MKFPAPHNPDSAFVEKTRRAFLSAYEARFPRALAPRRGWRYAARGLAAAIGAAVLISGASVYADERNVGPGNMLYSLKRSKEAVQLFFTSKEERPLMHAGLAERRLKEIEEVEAADSDERIIMTLIADLKEDIARSLEVFEAEETEGKRILTARETETDREKTQVQSASATLVLPHTDAGGGPALLHTPASIGLLPSRAEKVCASLTELMRSRSPHAGEAVRAHPKLRERCGLIFEGGGVPERGDEPPGRDAREENAADKQPKK